MIGVAGACVGAAGAQTNGPSGFSARIGGFFPTNSLASDIGGTWFAFGVDYKLNALSVSLPQTATQSYFGLSADYYAHGGDNTIPVAFTYNLRQNQMVFSAGIGPEFRNASDLTDNGVGLSGQVGFTYEFGNTPTPFFVQAKYFLSSRSELSGFGVYAGLRF